MKKTDLRPLPGKPSAGPQRQPVAHRRELMTSSCAALGPVATPVRDRRALVCAPVLVSIEDAFAALGIGRTKGYELIRDGQLVARKIGSRTVIEVESIRHFAAGLPRAGKGAC